MAGRALVLLLALTGSCQTLAECDCLWEGPFSKIQAETDLVVAVTAISSKGNSVDFAVNDLMRGSEHLPQIRVWMNPSQTKEREMCRPETTEFPADSQWVMALDRIEELQPGDFDPNTPNISVGRKGDYSLSKCGGYWLSRKDNLVSGNLVEGARWERNPKMSPVLLSLVAAFASAEIDEATLRDASKVDPVLQELQFETRLHLRREQRRAAYAESVELPASGSAGTQ